MNSIKEISSTVIAIKGKARLSEFRINSLKESLKNKENIGNLECCEIYFISLNKKLSQDNLNKLNNILSCSPVFEYDSDFSFTVIPRLGTISPWSSKASEILNNCGMDFLERIERGFYYSFNSQYKFETKDIRELADQLADRMTQDVMLDLSDSENIFSTLSDIRGSIRAPLRSTTYSFDPVRLMLLTTCRPTKPFAPVINIFFSAINNHYFKDFVTV